MKFIHAAEIHLDSPLSGLASYPDAPVEMLRTATRDAFTNLVNEAIEEGVDFVIIAGDLYDGTWKDYNTGYFFCRHMVRLSKANIPVHLLFGDHDVESESIELHDRQNQSRTGRPGLMVSSEDSKFEGLCILHLARLGCGCLCEIPPDIPNKAAK